MIELREIGVSDFDRVDRILDRLTSYSLAVDGVPKMHNAACHFLTARPPNTSASAKKTFEVVWQGEPVGLVDLIQGYPESKVAFIGLLAIAENRQRRGIGRATFAAVQAYALKNLGARKLRLAVVSTNDVEGFWTRMGFQRTGEVRPYQGEKVKGYATILEKDLSRMSPNDRQ